MESHYYKSSTFRLNKNVVYYPNGLNGQSGTIVWSMFLLFSEKRREKSFGRKKQQRTHRTKRLWDQHFVCMRARVLYETGFGSMSDLSICMISSSSYELIGAGSIKKPHSLFYEKYSTNTALQQLSSYAAVQ